MPIVTTAIATAAGAPLLLSAAGAGWTSYTVRPGDTLWDVASTHRTDVRTLVRANHLSDGGHLIRAGSRLRVPAQGAVNRPSGHDRARTARYVIRRGDTISDLALRMGVSPGLLLRLNHLDARGRIYAGQHLRVPAGAVGRTAKAARARASLRQTSRYVVRRGDTIDAIAARRGTRRSTVLKLNRLSATSVIHPGQRLRVPATSRSADFDHNTFAGRTYADSVVRAASINRAQLAGRAVPGRDSTRRLVAETARRYGVDPALAMAVAYQESGFDQRQVSVANAIGTMQVIPSSGRWAGDLVGHRLNLLDTHDNITAGVVILKALTGSAASREQAVAGYYQGLASVRRRGMLPDTKQYVANILRLSRRFG
jgi:LysM repeat protein